MCLIIFIFCIFAFLLWLELQLGWLFFTCIHFLVRHEPFMGRVFFMLVYFYDMVGTGLISFLSFLFPCNISLLFRHDCLLSCCIAAHFSYEWICKIVICYYECYNICSIRLIWICQWSSEAMVHNHWGLPCKTRIGSLINLTTSIRMLLKNSFTFVKSREILQVLSLKFHRHGHLIIFLLCKDPHSIKKNSY